MWEIGFNFQTIGASVFLGFIALLFAVFALQALGVFKHVPFSYNLRNVVVRWQTTFMTALTFTAVIGLMTVMLAFVNGMFKLTQGSGVPENVMVLADGATDELFSNLGYGDIKEIELRDEVARDDEGKPLASWEVYVVVNQPIPVRDCPVCGDKAPVDRFAEKLLPHGEPQCAGSEARIVGLRARRFIQVRGIEDPARSGRVHNLPLHEGGKWFGQSGVEPLPGSATGEQAIQAVLGEGIARELGNDKSRAQRKEGTSLKVGDVFELGARRWIVAGIMKSSGSMFDSEIWAKFSIVGEQFGKNTYTTCVLRSKDADTGKALAKDLSANFKKPAVSATPEPEYYERLNTTNKQFLFAIQIVVAMMAIAGIFGVMNTMFAAIAQRTKDIGVLRIIGYSRWQVLSSFLMESLVLAIIGGVVGCSVGLLAHGQSASSIMSSGPGGGKSVVLTLVVDWQIITAGMGFALMMGLMGGLLPALSAIRLKPLDSVR